MALKNLGATAVLAGEGSTISCGCIPYAWIAQRGTRSPGSESRVTLVFGGSLDDIASKLARGDLAAGEYSLATYLMQTATSGCDYVAVPVFPFRSFRHSMLWVRRDGPIEEPSQLVGRRIGVDRYGSTAIVHLRGVLTREHAVSPDALTWIRVGTDIPDCNPPISVEIEDRPGADLIDLLTSGAVDAIASFWRRRDACNPKIHRLFRDAHNTELAYYHRTGSYPIMHVIVLRRAMYEENTRAADWLIREFVEARKAFFDEIDDQGAGLVGLGPWSHLDLEEMTRGGELSNPIGVNENRTSLETAVNDLYDQELIPRMLNVDDIFAQ